MVQVRSWNQFRAVRGSVRVRAPGSRQSESRNRVFASQPYKRLFGLCNGLLKAWRAQLNVEIQESLISPPVEDRDAYRAWLGSRRLGAIRKPNGPQQLVGVGNVPSSTKRMERNVKMREELKARTSAAGARRAQAKQREV